MEAELAHRKYAIALTALALAAFPRAAIAADENADEPVSGDNEGAATVEGEAAAIQPLPPVTYRLINHEVKALHRTFDAGMILEVFLWSANAATGFYPPAAAGGFGLAITAPLFLYPTARHMALLRGLGVEPSARARALYGTSVAFALVSITANVVAVVLGQEKWQSRIPCDSDYCDSENVMNAIGKASVGLMYGMVVPLGLTSMILGFVAYYVTRSELLRAAGSLLTVASEEDAEAEAGDAAIAKTIMPSLVVGKDAVSIGVTMRF